MDYLTVIITIVGMIAAFLTATFAEPLKARILDGYKLKSLRKALYTELAHNYFEVQIHRQGPDAKNYCLHWMRTYEQVRLRTETYQQAITSQNHLFYQLREASQISDAYSLLLTTLRLAAMDDSEFEKIRYVLDRCEAVWNERASFEGRVGVWFSNGTFDKKILAEVVPDKQDYAEITNWEN